MVLGAEDTSDTETVGKTLAIGPETTVALETVGIVHEFLPPRENELLIEINGNQTKIVGIVDGNQFGNHDVQSRS